MAVAGYVAEKFAAQFIKDEVYSRFREFFWPKPNYRNLLEKAIFDTIQAYRLKHPEVPGKLPFYLHKEIFEHLAGYILFKGGSREILDDLYLKNPQVALPDDHELLEFFNFFVARIKSDKKLKKVFVDEQYKNEIFAISSHLVNVSAQIKQLLADQDVAYNLAIDFYVPRKEEAALMTTLGSEGVLLLTGQSFCGKSQLAKMICLDHIRKGYLFLTGDSVEECRQELLKNRKPTIFLLEDPFSHVFDNNSVAAWRKLSQFLQLLPTQHKLIVTSRTEVIRQVNQDADIGNCGIEKYQWADLTVNDAEFISRYWSELEIYKNVPRKAAELISAHLRTDFAAEELQPGQLMYLANKPADQLEGKTVGQLCLLSRADAKEIAAEIIHKQGIYPSLYIALGLSCDTIRPVSLNQLHYMLAADDALPGFKNEGIKFRSFSNRTPPVFPAYPPSADRPEILEALSVLQLRGYIKINGEYILFSHPTYKDAARYILLNQRADITQLMSKLLDKALAALQVNSILVAISQLELLLAQRTDLTELLQKTAVRAAKRTIFPAAETRLTELLVNSIDALPEEIQKQVMHMAQHRTSLSDIFWHEGTPFYSEDSMNTAAIFGRAPMDAASFRALFDRVSAKEDLPAEQIWQFIQGYPAFVAQSRLTQEGCLFILSYPEAFIRSNLAALTFKNSWPEEKILAAIEDDQHPEVTVEAIKGCFAGYLTYNVQQQAQAKQWIGKVLHSPAVIIRASAFFSAFGLSHATESLEWYDMTQANSEKLWQLWGDVFLAFFEKFPDYLEMPNSARFAANLHDSAKFITPTQGMAIGTQFYQWINRRLEKNNTLDAFELGLVSFILATNPVFSQQRAELLTATISHPHTGFAGVSLAQASWQIAPLDPVEKKAIVTILNSERPDARWLKAIAITRSTVIPEIQQSLLGKPDFLQQAPNVIIRDLDPQLLDDALHVYAGKPQPLWWYALQHSGGDVWLSVIKHIISSEYEPFFESCLKEMLGDVINGASKDWQDGQQLWRELYKNTKQPDRLAATLIEATAGSNFSEDQAVELWSAMIECYRKANNLPALLAMVADKAESLQHYDDMDIYHILKPVFNEFLDFLPADRGIILLAQNLEKDDFEPALVDAEVDKIMTAARAIPVKLKLSFRELKEVLKPKISQYPSLARLNDLEDHIDEIRDQQEEEMDDHYELPAWVEKIKK